MEVRVGVRCIVFAVRVYVRVAILRREDVNMVLVAFVVVERPRAARPLLAAVRRNPIFPGRHKVTFVAIVPQDFLQFIGRYLSRRHVVGVAYIVNERMVVAEQALGDLKEDPAVLLDIVVAGSEECFAEADESDEDAKGSVILLY